ncbi:MAG: hypothetical protein AB1635_15330 [Acidobacteriota bacterium]
MPTYWLSCHVDYQCRHRGACCTSGWPIPVEAARAGPIEAARREGSLAAPVAWLTARPAAAPADVAGLVAVDGRGHCVLRRHERCAVQATLGHAALPSACQHFPRVCLLDDRGVFVTLSHYCPTAAGLLADHAGPVRIVEGPPALPDGRDPEGLDARGALPPLWSPARVLSHDEYGRFEAQMVEAVTTAAPETALHALWGEVGRVRPRADTRERFAQVRRRVPAPWTWADPPAEVRPLPREAQAVAGRYLAAHAFASWHAYRGEHVTAVLDALEDALAVLTVEISRQLAKTENRPDPERAWLVEALRQSDLLLVHYADPEAPSRLD